MKKKEKKKKNSSQIGLTDVVPLELFSKIEWVNKNDDDNVAYKQRL